MNLHQADAQARWLQDKRRALYRPDREIRVSGR
jgi:hypothetical protein